MTDTSHLVLSRLETAAQNFIHTVDSHQQFSREQFLHVLSISLSELYSSALHLPSVEPDTSGTDNAPFPTDQWTALFRSLKEQIGEFDGYWCVFDSTEEDKPVQGNLSGDISEIYYDLQESLQLKARGLSRADLLWDLRDSFRTHWGRHALSALKAIHERFFPV